MYSAKEGAFLKDMQEAIRRIQTYTEDTDYDAFYADIKTQDTVMRNLEIIGEAAKQLPKQCVNKPHRFPGAILRGCVINSSITILASISTLFGT